MFLLVCVLWGQEGSAVDYQAPGLGGALVGLEVITSSSFVRLQDASYGVSRGYGD
jgi:hypothetical protein